MNSSFYLRHQQKLSGNKFYRRFWTFWAIYSILLFFAIGGYLLLNHQTRIAVITLAAFILARGVVSPLIYLFYKRVRPYQVLNFVPINSWLFSKPTKRLSSFPSDHAISLGAITAVLYWLTPVLGTIAALVTLINGWARIILGYHYPSDVFFGWVLGVLSAFITVAFFASVLFTG